jgi:hypothetical protein
MILFSSIVLRKKVLVKGVWILKAASWINRNVSKGLLYLYLLKGTGKKNTFISENILLVLHFKRSFILIQAFWTKNVKKRPAFRKTPKFRNAVVLQDTIFPFMLGGHLI